MALLKIIKLSTKTWKHNSDVDGDFILTKFYAKQEDNEFLLVETYGAKRRKYLISEIEVYDIGGTAETFSNFTDLFLRLEALKYPAFYVDGESTGGGTWGSITGTLSDQTDLQSALDDKQDKLTEVNFGAFMDTELPIKSTPSPNDNFLGRDSITNEAVEFNYPIVEGYFNGTNFYLESGFINLITATSGRTYIDLATNLQYRWSGSAYVQIGGGGDSVFDIVNFAQEKANWNTFITKASNSGFSYLSADILSSTGTVVTSFIDQAGVTIGRNTVFRSSVIQGVNGGIAEFKNNLFLKSNFQIGIFSFLFNLYPASHSTFRSFAGMCDTTTFGNINPSQYTSYMFGIGCDDTDTTYHLIYGDTPATRTKIDLGWAKNSGIFINLFLNQPTKTGDTFVTIKDLTNSRTYTTTIPYRFRGGYRIWGNRGNTSTSADLAVGVSSIELFVKNDE